MDKISHPFFDSSLSEDERLDALLREMTIQEKLHCLSTGLPAMERLGIPAFALGGEAAHGVEARNDQGIPRPPEATTSFVQPIGMCASWDRELIREAGEVTGRESRVLSHRHPGRGLSRWAPTVDLERDPRWGRTEEGYGEDPLLTGEMASAYMQGMEGDDSRYLQVGCTLKHFYGNNVEEGRNWKNSSIDPRNRNELYLEPFRRCIQKGRALGVMAAYNKINGIPGMVNPEIQSILKDQYGLVHAVSDGGALTQISDVHHYRGTHAEALAEALKAGVDAFAQGGPEINAAAEEAWELGLLEESDLDRAIRNLFRVRLRLGIYDEPGSNPYDRVTEDDLLSKENEQICLRLSREAVVLLKNENNTLPLTGEVTLIGPYADAWHQDWYGGKAPFRKTLKDGVEEILGKGVPVTDGWDRVIFRQGDRGLAAGEDGFLRLSDKPEVFILERWDQGFIALKSERSGKYMNLRLWIDDGISLEKEEAFDWFMTEGFHLGEDQGQVTFTDRYDRPLIFTQDGSLKAVQGETPASFTMEVQRDGIREAVEAAKQAKTPVLALGTRPMMDARETLDRISLAFPEYQQKLFDAVIAARPDTVVVLFANYPYAMKEISEKAPAILMSATGAQDMGTAMAETLFGLNSPAGRLNMTWYRDDADLPDMDDYDIIAGNRTYRYFPGEVLYPFGFGLTYTEFSYRDLEVKLKDSQKLLVSLSVTNTGNRISDEVVELYGSAPPSRVKKPICQLLDFTRLHDVLPGETRKVEFSVPVEEFLFYDTISRTMMVEEGSYTIFAGKSSQDRELSVQVEIPGRKPGIRDLKVKVPADHYDTYQNITLVEGHFHYSAATPLDPEKEGILRYGDCSLEDAEHFVLHLKSEKGCTVEILSDGVRLASWEGNTRDYRCCTHEMMSDRNRETARLQAKTWPVEFTDVVLPVTSPIEKKERHDLEIRICGDVRLSYFHI